MKTLLLLAIFAAVSSAYIFPTWINYNPYGGLFTPTAVVARDYSALNTQQVLNVCGLANANIQVYSFSYQVGQGTTVWYSGNVNLAPQDIFSGASYCFYYSFLVPPIARPGFDVYLTLNSQTSSLDTVKVSLTV